MGSRGEILRGTVQFRAEGFTGPRSDREKKLRRPPTIQGLLLGGLIVLVAIYPRGPVATVPSRVNFGPQEVGALSGMQVVSIANRGSSALHVVGVTLDENRGKDFKVAADNCSGATLDLRRECTIGVEFIPQAIGDRSTTLRVADDARDTPQSVLLRGSGMRRPDLVIVPTSLTFAPQELRTASAAQPIVLRNISKSSVTITHAGLTGRNKGDFNFDATACTTVTIAPQQECSISVGFSPKASRDRVAGLSITDDTRDTPHIVQLEGHAISAEIGIERSPLVFGKVEVGRSSPSRTLTFTSKGSASLQVAQIEKNGQHAADFEIGGNTCTHATLPPDKICTVSVHFSPRAAGNRVAGLTIRDNAGDGTQFVDFSGTGITPDIEIQPTAVEFAIQQASGPGQEKSVTVRSVGEAPLRLGMVSLQGGSSRDFRITSECDGKTLFTGSRCTIGVVFRPGRFGLTSVVERQGLLIIPSNAAGSPQRVRLRGVARRVGLDISIELGNPPRARPKAPGDHRTPRPPPSATRPSTTRDGPPNAVAKPRAATPQPPPSSALPPPTRREPGRSNVAVDKPRAATPQPPPPSALPTRREPGPSSVTVPQRPSPPIEPLRVTLSPPRLAFAPQPMGSPSALQTVTVTNPGPRPLVIGGVQIMETDPTGAVVAGGSANFFIQRTDCRARLQPQQSCNILVYFRPRNARSYRADSTVFDDRGNVLGTARLTGTGTTKETIR